jgi:uncharacterized membrane protein
MEPISKVNLERITNGIYAFTMTLMVRNIQVPPPGTITDYTALSFFLFDTSLSIADFVGAFLILGMFWLFYFQVFHRMKSVDNRFIYLHLLSLMIVVFVPFTQSLAAQSETIPSANLMYQVNYLFLAVLLTVAWHHARSHPALLVEGLDQEEAAFLAKKYLVPLCVAVLGIVLVLAGFTEIDLLYLLPFLIIGLFFRKTPGDT